MPLDNGGFVETESTYQLAADGSATAIDVTDPRTGPQKGVYRLAGDSLRVLLTRTGTRPKSFDRVPADAGWHLRRVAGVPAVVSKQRYPNDVGWFWMFPPEPPITSKGENGVIYASEKDWRTGAAEITLAAATALDIRPQPEYRVVLFDAAGTRFLPQPWDTGAWVGGFRDRANVILSRWRMDPAVLPADKLKLIGIEQRIPDVAKP